MAEDASMNKKEMMDAITTAVGDAIDMGFKKRMDGGQGRATGL